MFRDELSVPICKGQAAQETSVTTNLRSVTSQKSDLIYEAAEAWNPELPLLLSFVRPARAEGLNSTSKTPVDVTNTTSTNVHIRNQITCK